MVRLDAEGLDCVRVGSYVVARVNRTRLRVELAPNIDQSLLSQTTHTHYG